MGDHPNQAGDDEEITHLMHHGDLDLDWDWDWDEVVLEDNINIMTSPRQAEDDTYCDLNNLLDDIPQAQLDPSFSIEDLEQMLMIDDQKAFLAEEPPPPPPNPYNESSSFSDAFLSHILVDSPHRLPEEVVDVPQSDGFNSNHSEEMKKIDSIQQQDNPNNNNNGDDDDHINDGPISKKRKRQQRNRDAAVRSRERKKMYMRDLEMKSRYYEAECNRLGMLLQCCSAENQALRLSLQNIKAFDASRTKQESAVLFLESLLLGSLLWFLGIMGLFTLPRQLQSTLVALPPENVDNKSQGGLVQRNAGNKMFGKLVFQSPMTGKSWKASRSRMKPSIPAVEVLV